MKSIFQCVIPRIGFSMFDIAIFIPAAGASKRMKGADKLLIRIDDCPILKRQTEMAISTGAKVVVSLPLNRPGRQTALRGLEGLTILEVKDHEEGMSASMREAAKWAMLNVALGMMVLLPDMPELETGDLNKIISAFLTDTSHVCRACDENGRPGHPVFIPARLLTALGETTGDDGGRGIIASENIRLIPLPGKRATTDLDTPDEWTAWLKRHRR
ncbi:MAG: nucleotidyltransferase family protein [Roseovarius sp.]|nr:nucleotidyltransferase family protein [Roseovarius sp.]